MVCGLRFLVYCLLVHLPRSGVVCGLRFLVYCLLVHLPRSGMWSEVFGTVYWYLYTVCWYTYLGVVCGLRFLVYCLLHSREKYGMIAARRLQFVPGNNERQVC